MRIEHFEKLKPICPRCNSEHQILAPLTIAHVARQSDNHILEGNLVCSNQLCQLEYPIIDGIPIIVNHLRKYMNDNFYAITARDDLSPLTESLLGDFSGPGSAFNTIRHYQSTYAWDHFADLAPENEFNRQQENVIPGSIVNCLNTGIGLFNHTPQAPALDIGCAVGRSTFEIAKCTKGLTLGIDMNFSLLRTAHKVLREGQLSFPLKRTGIVYDQHEFKVDIENKDDVDFWACDATALPFENECFQFSVALNVLDAVNAPKKLLESINHVLTDSGYALLATPYDWSPPVAASNWLGGHSQRGPANGSSETVVKNLLTPENNTGNRFNLALTAEIEHHPWNLRVHNRRSVCYDIHILACQKLAN